MDITDILQHQSEHHLRELNALLQTSTCKEDVYHAQSVVMREFVEGAFQSSLSKFPVKLSRRPVEKLVGQIAMDANVLYDETQLISEGISDSFNESKDYRTRARNRAEYLMSLVSNLNIMKNDTSKPSISFFDGLTNYDLVDENMIIGTRAAISTAEGLAHLALVSSTEHPLKKSTVKISGNGQNGNYGLIVPITSGQTDYPFKYLSEIDPHDSVSVIFDNNSSTWFEYEAIGSDDAGLKNQIDLDRAAGNTDLASQFASKAPLGETLSLTILSDIGSIVQANWLDVLQYIPSDCRSGITVNRIYTSLDGTIWEPLYPDREVIDQTIHAIPQVYDTTESATTDKAMGQGTFIFNWRKLRYLRIIFSATDSYAKTGGLGYTRYIAQLNNSKINRQISSTHIPEVILDAPQGVYNYNLPGSVFGYPSATVACRIEKRIMPVNGWRYSIGLRDISLSARQYQESSVLISKRFTTEKEIEKVVLYASEMIPAEFIEAGLSAKSSWIRYYISYNDIDWLPISPMHHNQIGDLAIPPKFYDFNKHFSDEEKNSQINAGYIDTEDPVHGLRLKVEFTRPSGNAYATPILQAYTLRCFTKETL